MATFNLIRKGDPAPRKVRVSDFPPSRVDAIAAEALAKLAPVTIKANANPIIAALDRREQAKREYDADDTCNQVIEDHFWACQNEVERLYERADKASLSQSTRERLAKAGCEPIEVKLDAALTNLEKADEFDKRIAGWNVRALWRDADQDALADSTLERLEKAGVIEPMRFGPYVEPIVKATCRGYERYDAPNPTERILDLIQAGRF